MGTYTILSESDLNELSRSYTYYRARDQRLIPDVYEPVEEDEPCRARSASPRLETGAYISTKDKTKPRQEDERLQLRRLPWPLDQRMNTRWVRTTPVKTRLGARKTAGNQTNKPRPKDTNNTFRTSQDIKDDKQSSFENWKVAGDRLFGRPSKSRQGSGTCRGHIST